MGTGTGRQNKRTSDSRPPRQTALQPPPPVVTTKLTIINEGARWSWTLEHYGRTFTAGTPPLSGSAVFPDLSTAADSALLNYRAVCQMAADYRSRARAARAREAKPSPG